MLLGHQYVVLTSAPPLYQFLLITNSRINITEQKGKDCLVH